MYQGVGTDRNRLGAQKEDHIHGCGGPCPFPLCRPPPHALPSMMNQNCLLTKRNAAHFSKPLSLYCKVSRESSHACSILDDTLNPIWLEIRSFALLHPPYVNNACYVLCVCVCMCACISMCKFVWAEADVCHVFAVISFSFPVSQDFCYTVCSACQALLSLRSNSQHCATVGKNEFFSTDLLWSGSKHTLWYGSTAAVKVDCLRVFLTARQNQTFTQGQSWVIYRK